jgi:hypothetical protein
MPVLARYILCDFLQETGEVVQAADGTASAVAPERKVFARSAEQDCSLDLKQVLDEW